jgi:SAM-dependent methyltransferase
VLLTQRIRDFRRRRIQVPVSKDALVLDVGSGDKPSWRADVLLDGYPAEAHAGQRSGSGSTRVTRPLFIADAADMPFADQAFDYVICSHLLEHVPDPGAVIAELTRVARAGYVEVPEAASCKIIDFPSHLWWCRLDNATQPPTLVMTAKDAPYFDAEINAYLRRAGLERPLSRLLASRFHHNYIGIRWEGSLSHRVEGEVSEEMLTHALAAKAHHDEAATLAARALTRVMVGRGHRAPREVRLHDVLRPDLRTGHDEVLELRTYGPY